MSLHNSTDKRTKYWTFLIRMTKLESESEALHIVLKHKSKAQRKRVLI